MANITRKLTHLLEPSSSRRSSNSSPLPRTVTMESQDSGISSPDDTTPPKPKTKDKHPTFLAKMFGPFQHVQFCKSCHSDVASSGEVFGLLKALAADQGDVDGIDMATLTSTPSSATSGEIVETPEETIINAGAAVSPDATSQGHRSVETLHQKDVLAAQLAALSMNNMSPLAASDHKEQSPPSESAIEDDTEPGPSMLRDPELEGVTQASDEEKLKAIVEEFGDIASGMVDRKTGVSEPERLLAEAKGSLFREVMMIGHLHLTTHRLLFHALLPPNPPETIDDSGGANDSGSSHTVILMNGPVTFHHTNPLKPARRVWMEVGPEMITTYPKGDDAGRTRPLRVIMLTSVRKMETLRTHEPCDFYLTYESAHGFSKAHFTVDTEQSAMQWRRQLEGALFHNAKRVFFQTSTDTREKDSWMMLRCCIPLDRMKVADVTEYHSFATLVNMEVASGDEKVHARWLSSQVSLGDPMWDTAGSTPASGYNSPRLPSDDTAPPSRATTLPIAADGKPPASSVLTVSDSEKEKPHSQITSYPILPHRSANLTARRSTSTPQSRSGSSSPIHFGGSPRKGAQWINSAIPAVLQRAKDNSMPHSGQAPEPLELPSHEFKVAVLNQTVWFVDALVKALPNSRHRAYKDDIKPSRMRFEVGGHDCLATDEEIEQESSGVHVLSEDSGEFDDLHPSSVSGIRKAEVIAMAARVFGFPPDTQVWIKRCYIAGVVPARGHILVTKEFLCFWRRATLGEDIKYRFSLSDIKGADATEAAQSAFHGLALHVHGRSDIHFDFWQKTPRDDVLQHIRQMVSPTPDSTILGLERTMSPTSPITPMSDSGSKTPVLPLAQMPTREFRSKEHRDHAADILALPKDALMESKTFKDTALPYLPFIANLPNKFRYRLSARHFVLLTIGSRGDVQPYIALGLRLKQDGHRVTIVTHDEFKVWITGYGIEHRQAGGDPTALMKLSAEHKMFSPGFFKESLGSFRQWLDDLLLDSWIACHDADVLIESPSTMSGIHIAEALAIPYFRAFTMPWTRTNAYPQAFMVPAFEMGPSFNYSTYVLFDNIIWRATAGQINRWRKNHLRLKATDLSVLSTSQVPFLYNFSSAVVPKPLDWHDNISITGYWNLEDSDTDWSPPKELEDFIEKAKADGKALVYIGFGSIVVPDPNQITKSIIKGVGKADVRAIIAKGWSSRGSTPAAEGKEIEFPANCYSVEKVPHGWLFPKVNAAMHHGGAGTVGASLRAGLPTIIKPWFGDQFFWAQRVTKLGAGLKLGSLRSEDIGSALREATTSKVMIEKAARVGQRIRAENGVENAIETISYNISRAAEDRRTMQWQK